MVIIPSGKGTIGGENFRSFQNEEPIYQVTINTSYALSETEITFEQYDLFCHETNIQCPNDDGWGRGQQPVINVTWADAMAYTEWLTKKTGVTYRLPSEAEWEFAARAGRNSKFWWGNEYEQGLDHCDRDLGDCPQGSDLAHPWKVGILTSNPFGLYDVTSNVAEWVLDCASDSHDNATGNHEPNYSGNCSDKIVKGANWLDAQPYVHHSSRMSLPKYYTSYAVGFRTLREIRK
ncbi:formylglycine-generating enzyme family protein [Psychromonas sp. Urea-02u-13]|uniref:formylglycine-generating enzyme family protein n=1 Tax=Psychromonas sp. Urea-02u-13 TaxID=2058326 RepID=UPI0012FEE57E|nr:formylglycine-generating enzyme family protein [Psychromonas sp. Urea-02u-13]